MDRIVPRRRMDLTMVAFTEYKYPYDADYAFASRHHQ